MSTETLRRIEEIKARAMKALVDYAGAVFALGAAEITNDEAYWAEVSSNADALKAELTASNAAICQALEIAVKALEDRKRFDGKLICDAVLAQIEEVLK